MWISIKEFSEKKSISERSVYRKIKEGLLKSKFDPITNRQSILWDGPSDEVEEPKKDSVPQSSPTPENGEQKPKDKKPPLLGKRIRPTRELLSAVFKMHDHLHYLRTKLVAFHAIYDLVRSSDPNLPPIEKFEELVWETHEAYLEVNDVSKTFWLDSIRLQKIHDRLEFIKNIWPTFFPPIQTIDIKEYDSDTGRLLTDTSKNVDLEILDQVIAQIRGLLVGLTDE